MGEFRRWDDVGARAIRLALFAASVAFILSLRAWVFPTGTVPQTWWQHLLQLCSWLWVAALPAVVPGLVGIFLPSWRFEMADDAPVPQLVCFRVVSRGRNAAALADTVGSIRAAVAARPLFPYCIEVVTDEAVALPAGPDLTAHVVPVDYRTPRGSLYKARALHYVSERSTVPDSAWVFHCDEESQVTAGLVGGIRDAVAEEEGRARMGRTPRIGQGCILYWRNLGKHPVLTLADSLRTGDDVTRFYTQFRTGALFCGMHGSFILVRADIERSVSFDVGPEGSVTEDAWWAFEQASQGRAFRWVDGFLVEQSPEHWKDFVKQRRRWYCGLWKVCLYAPAPGLTRAALMSFLVAWVASALGGLYTVVNLVTGIETPPVPAALGAVALGWYLHTYLLGLWLNLRGMPDALRPARARQAGLYVLQVVLMPVHGLLEAAGVLYGLFRPERGFHVVQKSGSQGERPTAPVGSEPLSMAH